MKLSSSVGLAACLYTLACGGGEDAPGETTQQNQSPEAGATTETSEPLAEGCDGLALEPPEDGVQLTTEMTLEPGEERQTCKLVLAGQDINFNYGEGLFTPGSHHATVWRTTITDAVPTKTGFDGTLIDPSEPVDCLSPAEWQGAGVIAAGHSIESTLPEIHALPDDVAYKVAANEVLVLNFHMINTTSEPVHACYKQNLPSIPADRVKQEAGLMFFYNPFIAIPAGGSATADMACPVTQDVTVSTAVSHMHQRGVGYTSELYDGDPSQDGQVIRTLHESTEWEEPLTDQFDPPLTFTAGEWVRFACDYDNTATVDVAQGQETTDEMCMFIGAYWPRNAGWEQCGFNGAGRNFGSGTMSGAEFADCWDSSPKAFYGGGSGDAAARYATMRCITESCPAVSARAADYIFRGDQTVRDITCD